MSVRRFELFRRAFLPGERVASHGIESTFETLNLEPLFLPTGMLVVCDPFRVYKEIPFASTVETGEHKVIASLAKSEIDERIAFVKVVFHSVDVVRWQRALLIGQSSNVWDAPEVPGFTVDSGYAALMDLRAYRSYEKHFRSHASLAKRLTEKLDERFVPKRSWLNLVVGSSTGDNVVVFSSGHGEGEYHCYFGYDEADRIACLLVDLHVVHDYDPTGAAADRNGDEEEFLAELEGDPQQELREARGRIRMKLAPGWEDMEPDFERGQLRRIVATEEAGKFSRILIPEIGVFSGDLFDAPSSRKVLRRVVEKQWLVPKESVIGRGTLKGRDGEIAWESFDGTSGDRTIAFGWTLPGRHYVLCCKAGPDDFDLLKPMFVDLARSFQIVD